MNNYFYIDKWGAQQGPRSVEQFKECAILTADTLVWRDGMRDWVRACEVDELLGAYDITPPIYTKSSSSEHQQQPPQNSYNQPNQNYTPQNKPHTWLAENIIATILCCFIFGVIGIIYSAKVDGLWISGKYNEAFDAAKTARIMFYISLGSCIFLGLGYLFLVLSFSVVPFCFR